MSEVKKFFTGAAAGLIPRDRWSRPLIIPPDGGKPVAYLRASSVGAMLEDQSNLTKWKQRQTILGLVNRPALGMAAAAAKDDKRKLDAIAEQAMEAAGSSDAAEVGTAIHKFTEDYDLGEDVSSMPPAYRPDLEAYVRATSIFEVAAVEQFAIADELGCAGTMDRLYRYNGRLYVGDVKTGSIAYGIGKIAIQLAIYAHGVGYDHLTGERHSLGDIDQNAGIIVHLPAGTGKCELVWVNLKAGFEAARDLALPVRDWRKRKDLSSPFVAPAVAGQQELIPTEPPAALQPVGQPLAPVLAQVDAVKAAAGERVQARTMPGNQAGFNALAAEAGAALLNAIAQASSRDELKQLHALNQPVWGADHTAAANSRWQEVGGLK